MVGFPTNDVKLALALTFVYASALAQTPVPSGRPLPIPPRNATDIVPATPIWFPPTLALATAIALVVMIGFFLWSRERRLRKYRDRLRKNFKLGEEILGAPSPESVLKRIGET